MTQLFRVSLETALAVSRCCNAFAVAVVLWPCASLVPAPVSYEQIHPFGFPSRMGELPPAPPIQASDGMLYGTAAGGGEFNRGVVYKTQSDGSGYETILHLGSSEGDAETPGSGIIEGSDGMLYGVASAGGDFNRGAVFKLGRDGAGYAIIHHFGSGLDGRFPRGRLLEGKDGLLYGTTFVGGYDNFGTIFRMRKDGLGYEVLHDFGAPIGDGRSPIDGVIQGSDNLLYGVTTAGGAFNVGSIYQVATNGAGYSIIYSFAPGPDNGRSPGSGVIEAQDGGLYGATRQGGAADLGAVYRLNKDGSGFSLVRSFGAGADTARNPVGGLMQASDARLYGTTSGGGSAGGGVIFRMETNGLSYAILHSLGAAPDDGNTAESPLMETTDGLLVGVTRLGGKTFRGTLFTLGKDGSNYAQAHHFNTTGGDGQYGYGRLTEASDGRLYSACVNGGFHDGGVVFGMNKDGSSYQVLHEFAPNTHTNGFSPWGTVIEATDGALYGATRHGGAFDAGVIFKINKNGSGFAIVRSFATNSGEGAFPLNGVIEGSDGRLYGRTTAGGAQDGSVIFGLNKNGTGYAMLHSFGFRYRDHYTPYSGLIEGSDGALYGTTVVGGAFNVGSVFKINKNGSGFMSLYDFPAAGSNGYWPEGGVMEASNGRLYGTTSSGGIFDWGVLFALNKDGSGFAVLHHFSAEGDDGYNPTSPPIEGPGGLLYGGTYFGGNSELGTLYKIAPDGSGFSIIYRFLDNNIDGWGPYSEMSWLSDGALYGSTFGGGRYGNGSVFRIKPVALTAQPDGADILLTLSGFKTHRYGVESATQVTGAWTQIAALTNETGAVQLRTRPAGSPSFYRATVLEP